MKAKILSVLSVCIMGIFLSTVPTQASSVNDLKNDLNDNQKTQQETRKKIDANKATMEELQKEIKALDTEIEGVEKEINALQGQINVAEAEVNKVTLELEEAVRIKEEQKKTLDERLRVMYMYSKTSTLEILFSARSFSDLITKIDTMKTIANYDQEVFKQLEAIEQEINEKKLNIEQKRNELVVLKNSSEKKKVSLNSVKATRGEYISALSASTKKLENELDRLAAESNNIRNQILSAGGIDTNINNGIYLWPVPGHNSISSPYGNRMHPILHKLKFHSGIDIPTGRRTGVNAIAVGHGKVIQSDYNNGGYGNRVTIDLGRDGNGNRVHAVYAHLAKRYVSVGQTVSSGQAIGEVGTTGSSTGIHLHFEIRINGDTVNPINYVR